MAWSSRTHGIEINMTDEEIEAFLHERGWWNLFVSARDRARMDGNLHWGLLIVDVNGDLHAFAGLSGHPKPEDNGYLWYRLQAAKKSDSAVESLYRLLDSLFPSSSRQITALDFHDVGSLN